jgi:hypothetical protein
MATPVKEYLDTVAYQAGVEDGQAVQLKAIFDGLAKSGLDPADYMAIIRLINRILGKD